MSDTDIIKNGLVKCDLVNSPEDSRIRGRSSSLFTLYSVRIKNNETIAAKVVKPSSMAYSESKGLRAIRSTGAPAPEVLGVHAEKNLAVIFMQWIESGAGRNSSSLMKALMQLYSGNVDPDILSDSKISDSSGEKHPYATKQELHWGWPENGFIGSIHQQNGTHENFENFWIEDRLEHHIQMARKNGLLDAGLANQIIRVSKKCISRWDLNSIKPTLIHGDLWSGNVMWDKNGDAVLIDPCIAIGNPEQDLAMLELFSNPLTRDQTENLLRTINMPEGFHERIPFWQIYPLLVHVNIFGNSYVSSLQNAVESCAFMVER